MKELTLAAVVVAIIFGAIALTYTPAVAQTTVANFADEEVLQGTLDGVNNTFRIVRAPLPWISLKVFENGIRLRRCRDGVAGPCDYTLVAPFNTIVFQPNSQPQPGDLLLADYRY